jgi:selenocysteine lyase/cysteine desulfurase
MFPARLIDNSRSSGVAIRAGHHCTQPLHRYLVAQSTARASLSFLQHRQEIDVFITTLKEAVEFLVVFLVKFVGWIMPTLFAYKSHATLR